MFSRSRYRTINFRFCFPWIFILFDILFRRGTGGLYESQGPVFLTEPPGKLEFINSRGGKADCSARGNPTPLIEWVGQDNTRIISLPSIRHVLINGTLHFPPFEPDAFRQDIHWTVYRCVLTNRVGTVISRDVTVRAVVNQRYEPEVQSPGGFLHNSVLFRCNVPSFVRDYVSVTSWLQESAFNIYPSITGDGKYHMLPTGELLITNITVSDAQKSYRCRTHHRLTQETSLSRNEGKIQLSDVRGPVPPILNKKVLSITARAEDAVVIPCVAYANPAPFYSWTHVENGREVPVEMSDKFLMHDGVLVIQRLKRSDSGSYKCIATNHEGSDTQEVQLSVTSPLSVHVQPVTQTAHLGKSAELECVIIGFPWTGIQWIKDGHPVRFGSRIRQTTDTRLEIASVSKEDKGMYQCVVKNEMESRQGSGELLLGEVYPHLTYRFIDQTIQPGPSVSLKCSASGNPTPQISWLLDGVPVGHSHRLLIGQYVSPFGEVVSHVNISSVKPEDGGEYECIAENRVGKVTHSARLNIYGLPFVRLMPPVSAVAGKDLVIKCSIAGYPVEEIIWEKEGTRLPSIVRQRVYKNALIIENVERDTDEGKYSCSASNKQGHSSNRDVEVKVIVPPKITPFTFARDLKLGDRISVQCVVVSGDLPLSFVWLKDGSPFPESEALSMRRYDPFTSALTIGAISPTHSGNYTCRATNHAATASHTAPLRVNVPPRISPFYFEDRVITGMRTQVMCLASQGDRPFNISWRKDGERITDSDVHISDFAPFSSILTIDNVAESHSGNYTCTVTNAAGRAEHTADLSVTVPPFWVVEPPREQHFVLGNKILLHCQADGFPKPTITWKQAAAKESKNTQPGPEEYRDIIYDTPNIIRMENGSLVIVKSAKEHGGYYMCEASNGIGAGKSKFIHLILHAAPRFQFKTKQETVRKGDAANLRCQAEGDIPMEITWKTNERELRLNQRYIIKNTTSSKGMTSELTILGVTQMDRGEYICQATNAYGKDHTTVLLLIQEPPTSPRNLKVDVQSSRSVMLSWSPPISDGDTKITNYILQFKELGDIWQEHNSQKVVPGGQAMTLVAGLKPATTYNFRLFAENQLGTSLPSAVISGTTEAEPPGGAPEKVTAEPLSSTAARVTWQPPDRALWNGEITGYNVGFRKTGSEIYNWTYIKLSSGLPGDFRLTGLSKFTKYSIVISAKNAKGEGPTSDPVIIETMQDVPSESPQEVRCSGLSPQNLQITWRPPSASHANGIIQGYKVLYEPVDEDFGLSRREVKVTNALNVVLHGLQPYTNYSLKVLAYTSAGDGVRSPVTFCVTEESIPEAPSAVKAVVSSEDSVIISWLPPKRTNGVLTKYTVYIRVLERGSETKIIKGVLPPQHLYYEAIGLKRKETYEAWVTASTKAGQGLNTPVLQLVPTSTVPAAVISFGRAMVVPWKSEVRLPCLHVGDPRPSVEWRLGDIRIQTQRNVIVEEKSLVIKDVGRNNEGNYSCHVKNSLGMDYITYPLIVQVPPTPPLLLATAVTSTSVQLQWKQGDTGGAPIRGFVLSHRREGKEWTEMILEARVSSFLMESLDCGASYQFRLTAFNKIGHGVASKLKSVVTKGSRPMPPSKEDFISVDSNFAVLNMRNWIDGGCPLTHISVSYRQSSSKGIFSFDNLDPFQNFTLDELLPSTEYIITATAYNSAGSTTRDYSITTASTQTDVRPPYSATAEDDHSSFYVDTQIAILGVVSVMLSLMAVAGICFCLRKKPEREEICLRESQSAGALESKQEQREKYYTSVRKLSSVSSRDINTLERISENSDDIYPYATFHLPEHESLAGNPQKQPYLYENEIKQKFDSYGKNRRGNIKRKPEKSESEEYDSLGSDSDGEREITLRAESVNALSETELRYPRDATLPRHGKKDEHNSKYIARLALQPPAPHQCISVHGEEMYPRRLSPSSDRHMKRRNNKSRMLYESNIHRRTGVTMLPS